MAVWFPASVRIIKIVLAFVLLFAIVLDHPLLVAADKTAATVVVKDALTSPNQAVTIEAKLIGKGSSLALRWAANRLNSSLMGRSSHPP
ncbi:MAG: hypothetical protein MRJ68_10870 [Nitrospira sp.]|nr:hypothetical protein [Nitrospira sp.]